MKFLILFFIVGCAVAYPAKNYYRRYSESARLQASLARPRRAPLHRTMLISGYYRPYYAQRRTGFEPETAMTAFATGDSVAAGSYLGSKFGPSCASCGPTAEQDEFVTGPEPLSPAAELDQGQFEGEKPGADFPEAPESLSPVADIPYGDDQDSEIAPLKPVKAPSKKKSSKKVKKPEEDTDSDDVGEESLTPGAGPYNSFFPIMFRGYPGRSASGGSGGGGVTAIANSYSTGKGGVATSHATAYGGPSPSRSKKRTDDDDEE